jgi:hypothetical protein
MAWSGTAMAASGPHCNGVFKGKTPNNPITKVADKTEAYAGQTVTFTVSFKSTGPGTNVVTDCYRVGDGSNSALNALVTGLNVTKTTANVGPKGTWQHVTFSIVVPSGLSGHFLVDRAKATKGSVESRSDNVSVRIIDPPAQPCTSNCGGTNGCTSNCGGTTGGGTTGGGTTVQGKTIHNKKASVKGVSLAHTGPVSAKAAFLGSLMVMIGLATRIKRPQTASPMVEVADYSGSAYLARYDTYLQAAIKHLRSRNSW